MPIKARDSETVDANEVGKHYTGVDATLFGSGSAYRYGFVYYHSTKEARPLVPGYGTTEVMLPFAPQSISVDEPAATVITPTLNGGKFVERRGQIIKTITISGTTGYNYRPQIGPQIIRSSIPAAKIVDMEGPMSGMARFLRLRDLFRAYWEIFSLPSDAELRKKEPIIVWVNEKDGENWVVEPISFRMTRAAPRNKFTYQYDIVLQTITTIDKVVLIPEVSTVLGKIANVISMARTFQGYLASALNTFGNAAAILTGAIKTACDSFYSTANVIASGLSNLAEGGRNLVDLQDVIRGGWQTARNSIMHAYEEIENIGQEIEMSTGHNPIPFAVYTSASDICTLVAQLSCHAELFATELPDVWASKVSNFYTPNYGIGGVNETITDPLNTYGVVEAQIFPKDTLIDIAVRELGDAERFMEIAFLNGLKAPYISPDNNSRLPNTLAPGDPILIPATRSGDSPKASIKTTIYTDPTYTGSVTATGGATAALDTSGKTWRINQWVGFTALVVTGPGANQEHKIMSNTANQITIDAAWSPSISTASVIRIYLKRIAAQPNKSANDQLLGRDCQLDGADLRPSATGDIGLIDGTNNMIQAIQIKMKTRRGSLPSHPGFGLGAEPGQRALVENILSYQLAVRQTLLSDKRIDSITNLRAQLEGDTLYATGYVLLSGASQPFAVDTRGSGQ
jgi:hypothetical protein